MECQCGCGEQVEDASFKPGHDQRLRISLEKRAGGIEGLRKLVETSERGHSSNYSNSEECKKEIDDIVKTINCDQAEYDKQLLVLSSGFLAVSLAFIKDIVPLQDACDLPLLYSSFILLGMCIMLVLFSYQFSISGHLKAKKYWEEKQAGADMPFPFGHAILVKRVNWGSGFLFGCGVSFLVLFVILNLRNEANMKTNRSMAMDGAHMKTPSSNYTEDRGSLLKAPAQPATTKPNPPATGGSDSSKKK
jgi:hypothetical protein